MRGALMLEVLLKGVRTVVRLEEEAWSIHGKKCKCALRIGIRASMVRTLLRPSV